MTIKVIVWYLNLDNSTMEIKMHFCFYFDYQLGNTVLALMNPLRL